MSASKTFRRAVLACCTAAALLEAPPALADAEKRREEGRILISEAQVQLLAPLVSHCQSSTPDVREALAAGLTNFRSAMDLATKRLVDELVAQATPEELAQPMSEAEKQRAAEKMEEINRNMLEQVRQLDVNKYCASLADRLQKVTPESAWEVVLKGRARVEAAKQKLDAKPR